jgi:hypothetical protein
MVTMAGFVVIGSTLGAAPRTADAIGLVTPTDSLSVWGNWNVELISTADASEAIGGVDTFRDMNFKGAFSQGNSPVVTKVGNIIFSPTNLLIMEIGGLQPGSEHDQIVSSGHIVFDGTMQVSLINGFSPTLGQEFNLFDWVSASGSFDTINLPVLGTSLAWDTSKLYVNGALSIASSNLDGDFNFDSSVDAADYVVWAKNIDVASTPANYHLWRTNFGRTSASGGSDAPVPEPRSWIILALLLQCSLAFKSAARSRAA